MRCDGAVALQRQEPVRDLILKSQKSSVYTYTHSTHSPLLVSLTFLLKSGALPLLGTAAALAAAFAAIGVAYMHTGLLD